MAGPDSYYTPSPLADQLIAHVTASQVRNAIDFCVGDGDLIKAVAKRYHEAGLFGTDISSEALVKLKTNCPHIELGVCDFREDESVNNVQFLHVNTYDLIVLNPPFTCKGSVVEHLEFEGVDFKVSTAMLFLMRALRYLSEDGAQAAPDFSALPVTDIVRGCVRMQNPAYSNKKSAVRLIHTTNIQKGKLTGLRRIAPGHNLLVEGSGVVIPRVCNPNPNKIALLDGTHTYALSDCVIVLRTATQEDAIAVRNHILTHWRDFITIYKGTGAQYTTLARTKSLLGKY